MKNKAGPLALQPWRPLKPQRERLPGLAPPLTTAALCCLSQLPKERTLGVGVPDRSEFP